MIRHSSNGQKRDINQQHVLRLPAKSRPKIRWREKKVPELLITLPSASSSSKASSGTYARVHMRVYNLGACPSRELYSIRHHRKKEDNNSLAAAAVVYPCMPIAGPCH